MLKPVIRFSASGLAAAGVFILLAMTAFAWIFFVASKNPADSGESGIILVFFALPWISLLPSAWLGPLVGLVSIVCNALILYLVFGGLRITRRSA